jgi:Fe-S oxidoreductase
LNDAFESNLRHNAGKLLDCAEKAAQSGCRISRVLTSCGSCRDGLERHLLPGVFSALDKDMAEPAEKPVSSQDAVQFLLEQLPALGQPEQAAPVLYHAACHAEWAGVNKKKAAALYVKAINDFAGLKLKCSNGCCGESGLGAISSPAIYNPLRERKILDLKAKLAGASAGAPVLVGCPSCKIGISRAFMQMREARPVLHTVEYLAQRVFGASWKAHCRKLMRNAAPDGAMRVVDIENAAVPGVLEPEHEDED